jgi:hypothetical protein
MFVCPKTLLWAHEEKKKRADIDVKHLAPHCQKADENMGNEFNARLRLADFCATCGKILSHTHTHNEKKPSSTSKISPPQEKK